MKFVIAEPDLWSLCLYMCTQTKFKTTQEHVMDKKVAPSMARETPREAQRGPERPWGTDSSLGSSLTPVTTYRPELKKPAANSLIHQLTEHEMAADELFFN